MSPSTSTPAERVTPKRVWAQDVEVGARAMETG